MYLILKELTFINLCFQTPLHKAAAVGNPELVQLLISASVQLLGDQEVRLMTKDVDVDHNTPLMLAVEGGCASIAQLLIGYMKIHS